MDICGTRESKNRKLILVVVDGAIKPIIKWAGSKRKLLQHFGAHFPSSFDRYFEPFLGSASVALAVQAPQAILSDNCSELVETYRAVRDDVDKVVSYLTPMRISKKRFYQIRKNRADDRFERAAEFIFLNKACWNGLYRVNSKGEFNVPYGAPKSKFVFDETQLRSVAKYFSRSRVSLTSRDFAKTLRWCRKGDFVFLDPPYVTQHNYNGFAEWNEKIFSWSDQERLCEELVRLDGLGVKFLMTNANHQSIVELYDRFELLSFSRSSTLAGDSSKRQLTSELIVKNY